MKNTKNKVDYAARVCKDENEKIRIQTVKEHTYGVAKKAEQDGKLLNCGSLVKLICLLHDMGKNTKQSDSYQHTVGLGETAKSPIHSHAGARYIYETYLPELTNDSMDQFLSELIGAVVMSHHGLYNCLNCGDCTNFNNHMRKVQSDDYSYSEAKEIMLSHIAGKAELDRLYKEAKEEFRTLLMKIASIASKSEFNFGIAMLYRMLLSVLINADHSDAAEFSTGETVDSFYGDERFWSSCANFVEEKISNLNSDTELNKIRSEISEKAFKAAENDAKIVRLNVPTGGGKTLTGLRYAVKFAKNFDKKRIIYVAPFNSILEQNAGVFKEYLPEEVDILEHFGDLIDTEKTNSNVRYFTQNWGSPVIATSMVQFLNTLFSKKISSIRRMRGLINSVIIIDEVQSLPIKCTSIFNMAINFLSYVCNVTVVLCSATQPSLNNIKHKIKLEKECELISDFKTYNEKLRRTKIVDCVTNSGCTYEETAGFVVEKGRDVNSVLVVVNTKKSAKEIFRHLKDKTSDKNMFLFHLSTDMCPVHRQEVIKKLKETLRDKKKRVICVSTQLIEAGVDISFSVVVRSLAGLDSIIQAAGRCNRNMEKELGKVFVIKIADEDVSGLETIKKGAEVTAGLLRDLKQPKCVYETLDSPKMIQSYYRNYFKGLKEKLDYPVLIDKGINTSIYSLLSSNEKVISSVDSITGKNVNKIMNQSFKTAGDEFKAIEEYGVNVVVPYKKGEQLIKTICSDVSQIVPKDMLRELQKYSVNLSEKLCEDLCVERNGIYILKDGYYNSEFGFVEEGEFKELFY